MQALVLPSQGKKHFNFFVFSFVLVLSYMHPELERRYFREILEFKEPL